MQKFKMGIVLLSASFLSACDISHQSESFDRADNDGEQVENRAPDVSEFLLGPKECQFFHPSFDPYKCD